MRPYRLSTRLAALAAATTIVAPIAYAAATPPLDEVELASLSPELQAQVKARAVGGNSVTEVLLLNNIKIKHEASLIVAMDWAKGVAVVRLPNGNLEVVNFDPLTLQIRS